ncbi:sensor histidine kinase [Dyadobacter luticola]|uniref:Sensor histidine kinase n=1 Tax=Dyadobacter luticola TaxID=1979387 RepID=A0A5R9L2F1_9BACT|nr:sensor histidine kinase [Dyadobacter luticola]TLV02601.1 sensor histidine kinase [Dyadobacter luticola]
MNEDQNRFETVFECDLEAISDTVSLCVAYIEGQIGQQDLELGVSTRIKWVITEMLTNAIKHSAVEECLLTIRINDAQVFFEKKDSGKPLTLKNYASSGVADRGPITWPLQEEAFPQHFQVYHNGSESLTVLAESPNRVVFYIQEIESEEMPMLLLNTSEHFGLLILTKASDHFEYEYEPVTGINRFRSTFNLQGS